MKRFFFLFLQHLFQDEDAPASAGSSCFSWRRVHPSLPVTAEEQASRAPPRTREQHATSAGCDTTSLDKTAFHLRAPRGYSSLCFAARQAGRLQPPRHHLISLLLLLLSPKTLQNQQQRTGEGGMKVTGLKMLGSAQDAPLYLSSLRTENLKGG